MDDELFASLEETVALRPTDVPLRLHLADLLTQAGRGDEAVRHLGIALSHEPGSPRARELMAAAMSAGSSPVEDPTGSADAAPDPASPGFDWRQAETELGDAVQPMFVQDAADEVPARGFDVERTTLTLADVGGMDEAKDRLEASFLAPLRNPDLRRLYKKSLRGGLLLYGPPGCGKTFLARAVAGELDASFLTVSLADVLDMYIGNSEKNIQELFATARASAPCVLFLDELDAIGQKRSLNRSSGMRTTVNQLLTELDGVGSSNEGVYLLAATNQPWDVDPALRRPGRLDRTLLVLPPDRSARESILRFHLRDRPVEGIDLGKLAGRTEGFSGADLAYLCESASEHALLDSARSGVVRMITMSDFESSLGDVRSSVGPWLDTARNVAMFANQGGEYDELARYLRKQGRGR